MCGRFTFSLDEVGIREAFPWVKIKAAPAPIVPRYNIAPSQPIAVVANDGKNQLDYFVWGLIPSWAKDPRIGYKMINARGETVHEKPSFRAAFKRRRCLILADGFYEWQKRKENGKEVKTPIFIHMKEREAFAFAGLWERWFSPDGDEMLSCTIITTEPNELMVQYHNRMPVILPPEEHDNWLDPAERQPDSLRGLVRSYPAERMAAYPVSTLVNRPQNDSPDCIVPV